MQWLGVGIFTTMDCIQSLVGEPRSCKPRGVAKKKKKKLSKWIKGLSVKSKNVKRLENNKKE